MKTQQNIEEKPKQIVTQSHQIDTSNQKLDQISLQHQQGNDKNKEENLKSENDDEDDDDYKSKDEDYTEKSFSNYFKTKEEAEEVYSEIRQLSNYYTLNYSQFKNRKELQREPLKSIEPKLIQDILRKERQKQKRQNKEENLQNQKFNQNQPTKKRSFAQSKIPANDKRPQKRSMKQFEQVCEIQDYTLAKSMIQNFSTFTEDIQNKILDGINAKIQSDYQLFQEALTIQVNSQYQQASYYYDKKQIAYLNDFLSKLTPQAAILLNIKISLTNEQLMEEGNTLSQTLLTYLNKVTDYRFLNADSNFIISRFLNSLSKHIVDTQLQVEHGFIIFALKVDPSKLIDIISINDNRTTLKNAFIHLNYSKQSAGIIANFPQKFLWPELLAFFQDNHESQVDEYVEILAKVEIQSDPGKQMRQLVEIFAQRGIIVNELLKADCIKLNFSTLLKVLDNLVQMKGETITECFKQDSQKWETFAIQYSSKEDNFKHQLTFEKVEEFYKQKTSKIENAIQLSEIVSLSKQLSKEVEIYRHSDYQSALAGIALSQAETFIIVVSPTASGKTWIQGLISKYFCNQDLSVAIIEPNEQLKFQTVEKLGNIDIKINVITVEEFYKFGVYDDVIILDEYDTIVDEQPYAMFNSQLCGLWQLREKKVYAFSATSSISYEKLITNCVVKTQALKFKSEYEMVYDISPISNPIIYNCGSAEKVLITLKEDILKYHESKPIIVIHEKNQESDIEKILIEHNLKFFYGAEKQSLQEIRTLDYGILLLLAEQSRGIDTRFQIDSIVLIVANVKNDHQLDQMVGRSSRQRNPSESILYLPNQEKRNQVMLRLKNQNFAAMQELERILKVLEQISKNDSLVKTLQKSHDKGNMLRNLGDLEAILSSTQFNTVMKSMSEVNSKKI